MILVVSDIIGLRGCPNTPMGVRDWLKRHEIPLTKDGKRFVFHLCDLPAPERRAYLTKCAADTGLPPGA